MPFNLYPAMSVKTPLDFQRQNEEVKSARLSNMIDDFKLQQAQREQQQQQALTNLYQTLGPGLASGNPNALEQLSRVDPTAAQNFQKGALANQSAEQKNQVDLLDLASKRAEYIGNSAAAVLQAPEPMRPLMYQRALMDAKAQGIDISNLPQQYDPAVVQGIMTKALGAKETFDMQLRSAQQQEIERHNVSTEAETRRLNTYNMTKPVAASPGQSFIDLRTGNVVAQAPPSPKDQEDKKAAEGKAYDAYTALNQERKVVYENIDKALNQINMLSAGTVVSALGQYIPGSPAANLASTLNTIKANVGFDRLQQMRNNSPTGGALGQVSENENLLLQSTQGAIDQHQSGSQLKANLMALKKQLLAADAARADAFRRDFGTDAPAVDYQDSTSGTNNAETNDLLRKYGIQ